MVGWIHSLCFDDFDGIEILIDDVCLDTESGRVSISVDGDNNVNVRNFKWLIPDHLLKSRGSFHVRARFRSSNHYLYGSVEVGAKELYAANFAGMISQVKDGVVYGFVRNNSDPEQPVVVLVTEGDEILSIAVTGIVSSGSPPEGFSPRNGFAAMIPQDWLARPEHKISVVIANIGKELHGSPAYVLFGSEFRDRLGKQSG